MNKSNIPELHETKTFREALYVISKGFEQAYQSNLFTRDELLSVFKLTEIEKLVSKYEKINTENKKVNVNEFVDRLIICSREIEDQGEEEEDEETKLQLN